RTSMTASDGAAELRFVVVFFACFPAPLRCSSVMEPVPEQILTARAPAGRRRRGFGMRGFRRGGVLITLPQRTPLRDRPGLGDVFALRPTTEGLVERDIVAGDLTAAEGLLVLGPELGALGVEHVLEADEAALV